MHNSYIGRHLPPISPRIRFPRSSDRPLPYITPRTEFVDLQLMLRLRDPCQTLPESRPVPDTATGSHRSRHSRDLEDAAPSSPNVASESLPSQRTPSFASLLSPDPANDLENSADKYKAPTGQPGRPNSGGYNLEHKLIQECEWTPEFYVAVQSHVQTLARRNLDISKSYQGQNPDKLKTLCEEVACRDVIL
ncbi:hypothetical protein R3P38DRAFT_3206445 [Favolaschia claudopus]|uniref:Uncharacterized protein n=1 Tax=Favolaschia claudopus TaxID=2862362 RepID=A0AAW0AP79_9AGAR